MSHKVNLSIQVVPINQIESYAVIEEAIAIIKSHGYPCKVTPFATVVEATFKELMELITEIKMICLGSCTGELLLNLQFHMINDQDVLMSDKTKLH